MALGNLRMLQDAGTDPGTLAAHAEERRKEGATVLYMMADGKVAALLAIADPIKASAPAAIADLRKAGLRIVMLTGDNRTTAEAVGRKLGLDEIIADVLPEGKAAATLEIPSGVTGLGNPHSCRNRAHSRGRLVSRRRSEPSRNASVGVDLGIGIASCGASGSRS